MSRPLIVVLAVVLTQPACGSRQAASSGAGPIRATSKYAFHRAVANTLLRTEQARAAIPHLRRLQRLAPDRAEPYYLMARAYVQLGVGESAHRMLDRALAREPKLAGAHSVRGVLLDQQGRHTEAQAAHARAVELEPDNASFHNNLGFNLYLQRKYGDAAIELEKALELDAGLRRTHNNLGFALARLGHYERAYSHFRLACTPAGAENNMGLAYEQAGELDKARVHYAAALRVDPQLSLATDNLNRVVEQLRLAHPELDGQHPPPAKRVGSATPSGGGAP